MILGLVFSVIFFLLAVWQVYKLATLRDFLERRPGIGRILARGADLKLVNVEDLTEELDSFNHHSVQKKIVVMLILAVFSLIFLLSHGLPFKIWSPIATLAISLLLFFLDSLEKLNKLVADLFYLAINHAEDEEILTSTQLTAEEKLNKLRREKVSRVVE